MTHHLRSPVAVFRLTLWLCVFAVAVLFAWWTDADPADPPTGSLPPPSAPQANKLLIYSQQGWRSAGSEALTANVVMSASTYGDLWVRDWDDGFCGQAGGIPTQWSVFLGPQQQAAGIAAMMHALGQAEERALVEPQRASESFFANLPLRSGGGSRASDQTGRETWVYPTWDIAILWDSNETFSLDLVSELSAYRELLGSGLHDPMPFVSVRGASIVSGKPDEHARVRLLLQSFRRQLHGEPLAPAAARASPLDPRIAFHAGWQFGQGQYLRPLVRPLQAATQAELWPIPGGFLHQGAGASHTALAVALRESRLIRAVRDLWDDRPGRQVACLAAMSDDDPLIQELAFHTLTTDDAPLPGGRPSEVLVAWATRGNVQASQPYVPERLWSQISPTETARLITQIARTEPQADRLCWLLFGLFNRPEPEVRQAAQQACAARPSWETLNQLRASYTNWPRPEREEFALALHERLCAELSAGHNPQETARAAGEALRLAEGGLLPHASPARSRLRELGGWLVLHHDGSAFTDHMDHVHVRLLTLVELLRHEDPEVRRRALSLLVKHAKRSGSLPGAVRQAMLALQGDPYTEDLLPGAAGHGRRYTTGR